MPTIEVSCNDLCNLIGRKMEINQLKNDINFAKGEIEQITGNTVKIEVKDTNRPDTWSAEGIAREIRLRYKKDFPVYKVRKSNVVVDVDNSLKNIRPYTVCAVVKNIKLNRDALSQVIQLQEKVSVTFGRNRKDVAIGIYDFDKIKPPIRFTTTTKDGIKFIPLDFDKELTPEEILLKHPKGKEFGHLLWGMIRYPIFIDSAGNVLSMPPIINSEYTGKVTEKTRNIFIECSGFDFRFLQPSLNVIVAALHDRKGIIESVTVNYGKKKMITPDMKPHEYEIDTNYINKVSGLGLTKKEIIDLLERSGYKVTGGRKLRLLYPAYRQDIMHPRDVAEDVLISYGYSMVEQIVPKLATRGRAEELEIFCNRIAEILIGSGLQEILSYTLTNKHDIFDRMNLTGETIAEIQNPVSSNWSVFRSWLLPSLMDFLSKNRHVEYPQKIFEIGNCFVIDERQETRVKDIKKVAVAITDSMVNYEQISSVLDSLMTNIGIKYRLKNATHKSFIEGRCAEIVADKQIGIVGEINPAVLNNWGLEKPIVAFEVDMTRLFNKL